VIFFLDERRYWTRTLLNLTGATIKLALVGVMFWGVYHQQQYAVSVALLPGLDLVLRVRPLSLLFLALSAGLWLVTTCTRSATWNTRRTAAASSASSASASPPPSASRWPATC
jgi:formate hydrogenlyase subunit 3/multisubunit Na+/H+ antiporter MnhD subunit